MTKMIIFNHFAPSARQREEGHLVAGEVVYGVVQEAPKLRTCPRHLLDVVLGHMQLDRDLHRHVEQILL